MTDDDDASMSRIQIEWNWDALVPSSSAKAYVCVFYLIDMI